MELTRNKIIFFIIGGFVILFLIVILLIMLFTSEGKTSKKTENGDFVVWTVGDSGIDTSNLISGFQKFAGTEKSVTIHSFNNYEEYSLALTYAIYTGNAPDIFVLNNNEKNPIFENQVIGIPPSIVNPDYFRKNYKIFITDQLISKTDNGTEYLYGLPVGYETLGIFYNQRFVNSSDLVNFSSLNSAISRIKEKDSSFIPLAIGNGTTVDFSEDIATQFLLSSSGEKSLSNLSKKSIQVGLASYLNYGDSSSENAYNSRFKEMKIANQKGTDLFVKGDSFMLVGYPRLINDIVKKGGFKSSFLFAVPFPNDSSSRATLINYNYFVINKDSTKIKLAEKFISYLSSKPGIEKYFETFPYYLPASNFLDSELNNQKIHSKYNVKIGDFYDETANYTSFDKGIVNIYNSKLRQILDEESGNIEYFSEFQRSLVCKTNKIINQTDFSKSCE